MIPANIQSIYYDILFYKCHLYNNALVHKDGVTVRRYIYPYFSVSSSSSYYFFPELMYAKYGVFK